MQVPSRLWTRRLIPYTCFLAMTEVLKVIGLCLMVTTNATRSSSLLHLYSSVMERMWALDFNPDLPK